MAWRRPRFRGEHRPRAVWFALGTGLLVCLTIFGFVLLPLLGLLGGIAAGTVGVVRIPFGTITVVAFAGFALAAGLLALIIRVRQGWLAWILAVAAAIAALIVSLYPAVASVLAGVTRVENAIPWIAHLVHSFMP